MPLVSLVISSAGFGRRPEKKPGTAAHPGARTDSSWSRSRRLRPWLHAHTFGQYGYANHHRASSNGYCLDFIGAAGRREMTASKVDRALVKKTLIDSSGSGSVLDGRHSTAAERHLPVARSLRSSRSGSQTCRPTASRLLEDSANCRRSQTSPTYKTRIDGLHDGFCDGSPPQAA